MAKRKRILSFTTHTVVFTAFDFIIIFVLCKLGYWQIHTNIRDEFCIGVPSIVSDMREISYNDGQFVSSKLILFFFFSTEILIIHNRCAHKGWSERIEHWLPQQLVQSCFAYLAQCTELLSTVYGAT